MSDYSEPKKLAEALVSALNEYNSDDCSKDQLDAWSAADDAFQNAVGPEVVLTLIAENERYRKYGCDTCDGSGHLHRADGEYFGECTSCGAYELEQAKRERDELKAENAGLKTGYEAYEQVNAELKAEVEALRKFSPSKEVVWCSCGDGHAANSYGAGFMDANNGVCANCDTANASVEPDLDTLRKDAERYHHLKACNGGSLVITALSFDEDQERVLVEEEADQVIDAAMSKGAQV